MGSSVNGHFRGEIRATGAAGGIGLRGEMRATGAAGALLGIGFLSIPAGTALLSSSFH